MSKKPFTPRVYIPFLVNLLVGSLFLVIDERELAIGAWMAALLGFGVGYGTPPTYPDDVNVGEGEVSDE